MTAVEEVSDRALAPLGALALPFGLSKLRIRVRTRIFPDIVVDDPFGEGGQVDPFMQWLRPAASVELPGVFQPVSIVPYGEPPPTRWPIIAGVGIGLGLITGVALFLGVLRAVKGR